MSKTKRIPTHRFFTIKSTFDYAKSQREKGKEVFVVSKIQTQGRGRNERRFSSQKGGLYLTWLHYPVDLPAQKAFTLIQQASVAVCKTVEKYGVTPVIKWPNDILVDGKKLSGILTENTLQGGKISSSVIGIGVNVNNRLEEELRPIATTLQEVLGRKAPIGEVEKSLKSNLLSPVTAEEYFARLGYLGEVEIVEGEDRYLAYAEGVDDEGQLLLLVDGKPSKKSAAEISLRPRGEV